MKTTLLSLTLATLAIHGSSLALPRHKRQVPEFNNYPFKEICASTMGLALDQIASALPNGTTDAQNCHHYILLCEDIHGKETTVYEVCGIGMWWSFVKGTCEIPQLANRSDCAQHICRSSSFSGGVSDPRSCYGFYECEAGNAFFEMCENNSYFNADLESCEDSGVNGCDRPAPVPHTQRGRSCAIFDLPGIVCLTPGYIPSVAYCGCVHQHLERR